MLQRSRKRWRIASLLLAAALLLSSVSTPAYASDGAGVKTEGAAQGTENSDADTNDDENGTGDVGENPQSGTETGTNEEDDAQSGGNGAQDETGEEGSTGTEDGAENEDAAQNGTGEEGDESDEETGEAAVLTDSISQTAVTVNSSESDTVSLTENASISSYVIGDESWNYNNNSAMPTIAEVESQSKDRLIDGVLATGKEFSVNWSDDESWNDPESTRYLYVNMYRGDSRDITIDLGSVQNVTETSFHIAVLSSYGINAVSSVTFYLSEDGVNFYQVGVVTQDEATADPDDVEDTEKTIPSHLYYSLSDLNYNAQYVRVKFEVNVWALVDEILVNGYTEASDNPTEYDESTKIEDEVSKESYATTEQSGGVSQEYLAYQGWGTVNSELTETYKTVDEYKAAIAYVDESGTAMDWLYDGVTVLGHTYTKDGGVYVMTSSSTDYATKEDWYDWLDHVFNYTVNGEATNMDALDQAVAEAKEDLVAAGVITQEEADAYKVQVKLAVYPAIYDQDNWGTADEKIVNVTKNGDGSLSYYITEGVRHCNFTLEGNGNNEEETLTARATAYYWYMSTAAEMFAAKNYENIELNGFYYYNEVVYEVNDSLAADTVKLYNMLVDQVASDMGYSKLYSYWIPYYTAEGYKNWEEYGFDYAIMQPNAYNYGQTRLDTAADTAYFYGLGIEMEWMGYATEGYLDTFVQYLTTGASKGYQGSVQAWYWGTWGLPELAASTDYRYIYDLAYEYISGNVVYDDNLLSTAELSLKFRTTPSSDTLAALEANLGYLTDGVYGDSAVWASNVLQINNNTTATPVDIIGKLAETSSVTSLSMSFFDWQSAGVYQPYLVQYYISEDGESWQFIGSVDVDDDYTLTISNGVVTNYVMARVFNYAESGTLKAWLGVEEFIVKGSPSTQSVSISQIADEDNLLADLRGQVELNITDSQGTTVDPSNSNAIDVLIDGNQGGSWNGAYYCWYDTSLIDPFDLIIDLGEDCYVDAVSLSFYEWASAGVGLPESVTVYTSSDGSTWSYAGVVTDYVATVGSTTDPTDNAFVYTFSSTATTRYLRLKFERSANLYSQNGRNNWIALGEVMVEGVTVRGDTSAKELTENLLTLENVDALTVGFTGTPNDSGTAGLAALDAVKDILMDEVFGGHYPYSYNSSSSSYLGFNWGWTGSYDESAWNYGWGNDGYWIELALDGTYELSGIAIDFLHYPVTGIAAPDSVTFLISNDGETWTEVETVALAESITSAVTTGETKQYYVVNLDDSTVEASYIRWEFALATKSETGTYSFIMFDEIQVSGVVVYAAQIGDVLYETLQDAVDAVQDGETITILKSGETATVSQAVSFKVESNGIAYTLLTDDGLELSSSSSEEEGIDEIVVTEETEAAAQIGDVLYETLQDAVDAVQDGETITILKSGETATVSQAVSFKVKSNGIAYTLLADDGLELSSSSSEEEGIDEIVVTEETEAVAQIGDVLYETLQDAVDAVQDGETITILKSDESATVSKVVSFTIASNGNAYTLLAGSGLEITISGSEEDGTYDVVVSKVTEAAAQIGDVLYETLQDAVDAVQDGETITILKSDESATVSKVVSFTIASNGNAYTLLAGSGLEISISGSEEDGIYDVVVSKVTEADPSGDEDGDSSGGSDTASYDYWFGIVSAVNTKKVNGLPILPEGPTTGTISDTMATLSVDEDGNYTLTIDGGTDGVNAIPNSLMQALLENNVTLVMSYYYDDGTGLKLYSITIPAGEAVDDDTEWYGPLWLNEHYGNTTDPSSTPGTETDGTSTSGTPASETDAAQTGDAMYLWMIVSMLIMCGAVLGIFGIRAFGRTGKNKKY